MNFLQALRSKIFPQSKKNLSENDGSSVNKEEILKNLNGRTLMIYFVLLNKNKTGVRELQRSLELSSPSVARYHLDKLTELGLVENKNGVYHLIKKADIPALTSWVIIGRRLLPRVIFAACFFSMLFLGYFIFFFSFINKDAFFVILINLLIVSYLWLDVWWHLRNKPI